MDHLRHSRHFLLDGVGETGVRSQLEASVTIIGCGGLGQPVAAALGCAGIKLLRLADGDTLQTTNLARLPLMAEDGVGYYKAVLMAEAIVRNNKSQAIDIVTDIAGAANLRRLLEGTDIAIDATDNWPTRKALAEACREMGIPLVSGGALGTDGWVGVFSPSSAHLESWLRQPEQLADTCERVGVMGPLTGMIGNMMAIEALKLLWRKANPQSWNCLEGRVFYIDARRGECATVDIPQD